MILTSNEESAQFNGVVISRLTFCQTLVMPEFSIVYFTKIVGQLIMN